MLRAVRLALLFALAAAPVATGLPAQAIAGVVLDDGTAAPIPHVAILLLDSAGTTLESVRGDSAGAFRLEIPGPGTFTIRAEHLGYAPSSSHAFRVEGDPHLEVEFRLVTRAIGLPAVVVRTRSRSVRLADTGFYERRDHGVGRFISDDEIRLRAPFVISDLLRMEPSVQHLWMADENRWVVIFRGAARMSFSSVEPCRPLLALDGTRLAGDIPIDDLAQPAEIAGIEIYPSGNGAPPRFAGLGAPCGVILLWTRR